MIGLIGWGVILTAIIAWESISLVYPHDHWPTVSDMLRQVTRPAFGRWLLFALWLWLGWHLFVLGWDFFLRDSGTTGEGRASSSAGGPITLARIVDADTVVLFIFYALSLGGLVAYGRRLLKGAGSRSEAAVLRVRDGLGGLVRHVLVTSVGGYMEFLVGTTFYYLSVAHRSSEFVAQAVWGGAFLAFGVAGPLFVLLSWTKHACRRRGL